MTKIFLHLLSGEIIEQNRSSGGIDLYSYHVGHFVIRTVEPPNGIFCITGIDIRTQEMTLSQINCSPDHWQPDVSGYAKGPDDACRQLCPYYKSCPLPSLADS